MIKVYNKDKLVQYFQFNDNLDELNEFLNKFKYDAVLGEQDVDENNNIKETFIDIYQDNKFYRYISKDKPSYLIVEYDDKIKQYILKIYPSFIFIKKYYNIDEL